MTHSITPLDLFVDDLKMKIKCCQKEGATLRPQYHTDRT